MAFYPLLNPLTTYVLQNKEAPGISDFSGASSPRKWEERNGYGLSGSTVIFLGIGLAQFQIATDLYTDLDWQRWHEDFSPIVKAPPRGVRPKSMQIYHPILEDLGITSAVVTDVLQPVEVQPSVWRYTVKYFAYRKPVRQLRKPDGTAAAEITDPFELKIKELDDQGDAIAAENARLRAQ